MSETEVYNVTTGEFEKGPDLPFSFFKSPSAVQTPRKTILVLGMPWNSEENNQFFEYLPEDNTFNKLPNMPGRAIDMICGVEHRSKFPLDDYFHAYGGYE